MLAKLQNITKWQAALVIIIVGFAVFWSGLANPFMGDDMAQIVDNVPVHSITNLPVFFEGGTFYDGRGLEPLSGTYYRPLMTTSFSLLYTFFGAHTLAFHTMQLLLHAACAFLLFVIFSYFLRSLLSLLLSLVFLIHPINSQSVLAIPSLQEPLFMFFGLVALWLLLKFSHRSAWYLVLVGILLALSFLAKEAGILLAIICLVYLLLSDRKRFRVLFAIIFAIVAIYGLLRFQAVGLGGNPHIAPVDELSLGERLINIPSIVIFYFWRFIFPLNLAQSYYWAHTDLTIGGVWLPLLGVLALIGLIGFAGRRLYLKDRRYFFVFIFFTMWFAVALTPVLQIVPLDMTASETWFYLPIVGLLGMIGACVESFSPKITTRHTFAALMVFTLVLLGLRTTVRGFDWSSQTKLSLKNISVAKDDYVSYFLLANDFSRQGKLGEAKAYVNKSIDIYPMYSNYNTLGGIEFVMGNNANAEKAYLNAIKLGGNSLGVYKNLALLYAVDTSNDDLETTKQFYSQAAILFPKDVDILLYAAVFANNHGYPKVARQALAQAQRYGFNDHVITSKILNGESVNLNIDKTVR